MGLLTSQRPVIVVGDIRVDGDPHIGQVLHQVVGIGLIDRQAVPDKCLRIRVPCREFPDPLLDQLRVPAGIRAGLGHEVRIVRIQTKNIVRNRLYVDPLDPEFNGLSPVFAGTTIVIQINSQFLPCPQFDLAGLAGERVCPVDQDGPADSVQSFLAGK